MKPATIQVLLIEDNPRDVELLRDLLSDAGDPALDLEPVDRLQAGLARLAQGGKDVVLLDLNLPDSHGVDSVAQLQAQAPEVPVIVLTGNDDDVIALKAVQAGAQDFLVKGKADGRRLRHAIKTAIERQQLRLELTNRLHQLQASEARFRQLVDKSLDRILVVDHARKVRFLNWAAEVLFGRTAEEMVGEDLGFPMPAGEITPLEIRSRDGDSLPVEMRVVEVEWEQAPARLVLLQDLSHRRRAEAEISRLAAFPRQNPNPVYEFDAHGTLTYFNRGAQELAHAAGKMNPAETLPEQTGAIVKECFASGKSQEHLETELGDRVISWSFFPILKGQSVHCYAADITERKRLEAQFLRAQRLESIGALAGGIAHDLNNVLAPILMAVELFGDESAVEERRKMVVLIKGCAQRGAEMVKQIVAFARGARGQASVLQLKPVITEMGRLIKDTFPKSIQVGVKIAPELPSIVGNATQLHQVLMNLCVNARDAMPNGGELELAADQIVLKDYVTKREPEPVSGSYVVLSVSDTGEGMPPEVLGKVFEPFFTTKGEGKGTGLGLSTVQGIAKSHNGFVEVFSEVGKGTTFKVCLPAAPSAGVAAAEQKAAAPPMRRGEQILVVDDEIAMLEMTRETLETFNYRVLTARNGAGALGIYQRHRGEIQAVVTDMMMPIMDGPALIKALVQIDPEVKVIGVSGLGSEEVLTKAGELNVRTFLSKPYASASLLTSLREVLNDEV
jgi:two-component system cell cycle sensor histidine kinase/response regulator CckA